MTVKYRVNVIVTYYRTIIKVLLHYHKHVIVIELSITSSFGSFWVCLSENVYFESILKGILKYLLIAVATVKIIELRGAFTEVI